MKLLKVNKKYQGKFVSYYVMDYLNNEGNIKSYELVSRFSDLNEDNFHPRKPQGVIMVCFNEDKSKILIEREFRLSNNAWVYNFPGGLIDPGEEAFITAPRELREETGLEVIEIDHILPPAVSAVGIADELLQVVFLRCKGTIKESCYADEEIMAEWLTKDEALKLINEGQLFGARSQMVIWMWINDGK